MVRRFLVLPLLAILAVPLASRAGEKDTPPTIVLRVRSLDTVVDSIKLLAGIVGQDQAAQQIEGLIRSQIGEKGLQGVDNTRPLGLYARLGKDLDDITQAVSGAVLIPISDQKAFIKLLEGFQLRVEKGQDELYTVKTGTPIDAYIRFANKYAFITALTPTAVEAKNLLDPGKVLAGKESSIFAATLRLDQVPEAAKLIALAQTEQELQKAQGENIPGETKVQQAFRVAAVKEVTRVFASVLKEGAAIAFDIELDNKSGDLSATFTLNGQEKSELAAGIAALAKSTSLFGGMLQKDAAFNLLAHVSVPQSLSGNLEAVIEEGAQQALGAIQDPGKKKQAQAVIDVLTPTLKAGEVDGVFTVQGPSGGKFTLLGAVKVKEGEKIGKTLHKLVSEALADAPPAARGKINLDKDAVGPTKIHHLEVPNLLQDKSLGMLVGDPNLYVAFRDDAVFVALGKNGLQAIKDGLSAKPAPAGSLLLYEVDIARIAYVVAPPEIRANTKKFFPKEGDSLLRLQVEGGNQLTFRFQTRLAVLQFLSQVREARAGVN